MTVLLVVALLAICIFIAFRLWGGRKAAPKEGPAKLAKEKQVCSDCGTPRRPGARFCAHCGKGF